MNPSPRYSLVVPFFNEAGNILPLIANAAEVAHHAQHATHTRQVDESLRLIGDRIDPVDDRIGSLGGEREGIAGGQHGRGQHGALLLGHGLPVDHVERTVEQAADLSGSDLQAAARRWLQHPSLSLVGPATAVGVAERAWRHHPLSPDPVSPAVPG